jgi:hypothetical protein
MTPEKITALLRQQDESPTNARARQLAKLEAADPVAFLQAEALLQPPALTLAAPALLPDTAWTDWLGGNRVDGLTPSTPQNVAALKALVTADARPLRVRSSRHADNPLGQPVDRMIDLSEMKRISLQGDAAIVQAGVTIQELNAFLADNGKGLPSMGSFDHQTLPGALCTGTHGSYTQLGPLAEALLAIELLRPDGTTVLLQKGDPHFGAAAVANGLLGIVTSVKIQVRPAFELKEQRWTSTWEDVRDELTGVVRSGKWSDRVELLVNPFVTTTSRWDMSRDVAGHTVLVTERFEAGPWKGRKPRWANPLRHDVVALGKLIPTWLTRLIIGKDRDRIPGVIDQALDLLSTTEHDTLGTNIGRSDQILLLGVNKKAHGFEVAVPLDAAPGLVDVILGIAQSERENPGGCMLVNPFALRFVRATDLPLAMQHRLDRLGRLVDVWCMIEIPRMKLGNAEDDARHRRIPEQVLPHVLAAGGRPHWGQYNGLEVTNLTINGVTRPITAADLYPGSIGAWQAARAAFDPTDRMGNPTSRRLGL